MQEIEIFRQIIASCDDTLREVFLRRMEASLSIARSKLSRGEEVYTSAREQQVLDNATSGLSPELTMKATSLWKALLRMSRNRQYRLFLELNENLRLSHEGAITADIPLNTCCCVTQVAPAVERAFGITPTVADTAECALDMVRDGKFDFCAVALDGIYKTNWLFSILQEKNLYLNQILTDESNNLVGIISPFLENGADREQIISAVFYMSSESGSLAEALAVLADNKLNMEFIHMEKSDTADDMHQFLIFIDFDGNMQSLDTRAAIYQLESELPYFKIVGAR